MLSSLAPLEQRKKLHKEEGVVPGFPNAKAPKKQQSLKEGEKKKEEDDEKDEEEKMLKLLKKSEEKEKELKEMSAAMGMEEALCGDEPLIVPEFEGGSHETLYLEGSFSELEFPTASAACCGDVGFTRLFKLEDLLALEDTQGDLMAMTMEQEAPRVLQQGPDGHFDWVSATIDLDQMPHFEAEMMIPQHEDEFGSSRMPSPSPGFEEQLVAPLPLPASSSSSTPCNKKRKAVAPPVEAPLPVLAPKKRKIGVVMDDEEKRQRNRVSALKYRQKQRSGAYVTEDRIVDLERENQLLHFEIMKEKQAIAELRQLLTKHGVL